MVSVSARHSSFLEGHFGPSSQPINISEFLDSYSPSPLPDECPAEEDFQVEDIKVPVKKIWDNPRLSAHLIKEHDDAMDAFFRSTKPSGGKRRKPVDSEASTGERSGDVGDLIACLESVGVSSYRYPTETSFFTRATKHADLNTLTKIKLSTPGENANDTDHEALIIISIYTRGLSGLGRTSQHAFLSSQSFGDLLEVFPCISNDLPVATTLPDGGVTYAYPKDAISSGGSVILVEGVLYGDGLEEVDYADKLLTYLGSKGKGKAADVARSPKSMFDVSFDSLPLRTQEPYWILHQGSCEHFAVIDQIRIRASSDPKGGYPLTLQLPPLPADVCRGCCRVAASWSIVGDARLGESPCVLCASCWRSMGDPAPGNGVIVVPLPRYQVGWQ